MEVTLTMAPCAAVNSSRKPRASQMVAKRLTSKTWRQVARSVVSVVRRRSPSAFGEIDLDVILRPRRPWAVLRKGVARAGDDAPARARKALHRGMADAAARARENERFLLVAWRFGCRHFVSLSSPQSAIQIRSIALLGNGT